MQEIRGQKYEPAARLCPLGWTAIGRVGQSKQQTGALCANTGYLHTFCAQSKFLDVIHTSMDPDEELNSTLRRFWDLETMSIGVHNKEEIELIPYEKIA